MINLVKFKILHVLTYLVWIIHPIFWLGMAIIAVIYAVVGEDAQLDIYSVKSVHDELKDKVLLWYLKS